MLTIRMQRTGRKGYASFRIVVQDSKFSPTSGRVVAKLGHHNPHTKETAIDKELAKKYLDNGAQPSPRVVKLLMQEKVALPEWVEVKSSDSKKKIKNPEKLRKNQPKEEPAEEPAAPEENTDTAPSEAEATEVESEKSPEEEPAEKTA
jgi:small subunit ribosomal protein S16